jgi:hypothetical protein
MKISIFAIALLITYISAARVSKDFIDFQSIKVETALSSNNWYDLT